MLKIGDFSRLGRVTIKTLRYYDSCGLLKPEYTGEYSNYRYYSPQQLFLLNKIVKLKNLGFALADIRQILTADEFEFEQMLQRKRRQLETEIEIQQERVSQLDDYLKELKQNKEQYMEKIFIKNVPQFDAVTIKAIIPQYQSVGELWALIGSQCDWKKYGVKPLEECFTVYYDDGFKEKDISVELVQQLDSINGDLPAETAGYKLEYKTIPAVAEMAVLTHKGAYQTIGRSFGELAAWIEENGYTICGPNREKYLIGPWCERDPEKWRTEVQFPVSKR